MCVVLLKFLYFCLYLCLNLVISCVLVSHPLCAKDYTVVCNCDKWWLFSISNNSQLFMHLLMCEHYDVILCIWMDQKQ